MESKIINLNVPFMGLNKQPILNQDQSVQTLGAHFGILLASIQQGDPHLFDRWANAFFNNEEVDVSMGELQMLIQIATDCPLAASLRVQILNVLNKG